MNRSYRIEDNNSNSFIPSYSGTNGAVATHSNLSSMTAYNILNQDRGNAFDAAAGAMLVEGLVNPQMFGMGGEGVMILKPKNQNPVVLNGNTLSPRKFNFLNLVTRGFTEKFQMKEYYVLEFQQHFLVFLECYNYMEH